MTAAATHTEREIVTWARARGWVVLRRNAAGHLVLRHPTSGAQRPILRDWKCGAVKRAIMSKLAKMENAG